ncbi:putative ABC transporter ATP-binding protein [Spirochaetia bacterium]|nr:putative ABC transporter ATP-binding protein [Spirochaetia bacterium]
MDSSRPAQSIVLQFKDFTFQYKAQAEPSLHNINLTIRRGEKILILGPSGSGKSTLIHCINGLVPHAFAGRSTGSLSLMGENILSLEIFDISKKVGTVLQDTDGQFVGLSAAEDIAFAAENDAVPTAELHKRVRAAAEQVHIEDHLEKSPQDLSGGQKQRVSMAGVLIDNVDILLFDEPLANLDPAAGQDAIEIIDRLHRETGKTVIIVEHRLEDALHRSVDRIVLIDKGRIIADMPPSELLAGDLLRQTGIREPLYLSALRYAGIPVTSAMHIEDVNTVEFEKERLQEWNRGLPEDPVRSDAPPLLEVTGLGFAYPNAPGKERALENISFTLRRGESVSLVGKNGAGKSTLAKLICGFNRSDTGTLFFEGKDLKNYSIRERAEHIGYVMQNPNQMFSCPKIFDEAAMALRTRGFAETEVRDRVHHCLNACGLYPFRSWPISALSFGQKKRLSIAAILVTKVSLLILDEPAAGQDHRHYTEIMEFLEELKKEWDLTALIITHNMHMMLEYTTQALVLADGRLIAAETPAEILTNDEVITEANLKRTSLYDLALRAGIADARSFVQHFINYEREQRAGILRAGGLRPGGRFHE